MKRAIRFALESDAEAVAGIYAPYVNETAITFENTPPDASLMRSRIREISKNFPYLVLEEECGVTGYAYAHAYKPREAYSPTVELSVYVDKDKLGAGRGKMLTEALIEILKNDARRYTAIANITSPNEKSERMFLSLGFKKVSEFRNVGFKFGRWQTVCDYILPLKAYDEYPKA